MVKMTQQKKLKKFNLFLYVLLHLTFIPYLVIKYRIKAENKNLFKTLKPPFILIPNHVTLLDPPMVNIFVPHRIHYLMSDANLRSKIAKWAYLKMCAVVPKTKAMSDSAAVRQLLQLVKDNRIICVFPEGRASWDGVTHDIFYSTSKLVRILKIPVVIPLIKGGYLSRPRWSHNDRRGRIIIHHKKVFDGPELAEMDPETIHARLVKELEHDDYQFQKSTGIKFKTKKGAEYLERFIFICPVCKSFVTLRSEKNRFICSQCGFETHWTEEGYLKPINHKDQPVRSVTEWAKWQNDYFTKQIEKMIAEKSDKAIFVDHNVVVKTGYKFDPLETLTRGQMSLFIDRFVITSEDGKQFVFPIQELDGVQVLLANRFEFYYQNTLYKFEFESPRISGYKYLCAIQKIAPEKAELE